MSGIPRHKKPRLITTLVGSSGIATKTNQIAQRERVVETAQQALVRIGPRGIYTDSKEYVLR
jgi:hypothetical protein